MKLFLYNDNYNFEFTDKDIVKIDIGFDEKYMATSDKLLCEKSKSYYVYRLIIQPDYDNVIEFRTLFDSLCELKGEIVSDNEFYHCVLFGCIVENIDDNKVIISVQYTTWKKGYEYKRVSLTPKKTWENNK